MVCTAADTKHRSQVQARVQVTVPRWINNAKSVSFPRRTEGKLLIIIVTTAATSDLISRILSMVYEINVNYFNAF